MAELGLGAVRPLNKEKRGWINKLVKDDLPFDPILVTRIKDSGYYLLTDGWHRVQAAKKKKEHSLDALVIPADVGLSMAKGLAYTLEKPLIPIDTIESINFLVKDKNVVFNILNPYLTLFK